MRNLHNFAEASFLLSEMKPIEEDGNSLGHVLWFDNVFHGSYHGKWDGSDCFENQGMSSVPMQWCPVNYKQRVKAMARYEQIKGERQLIDNESWKNNVPGYSQ